MKNLAPHPPHTEPKGIPMHVQAQSVTPEQAAEWLKQNTRNRNLNQKLVAHYARQMSDDRWTLNGEAIKIAVDGTILDGQHRLEAIVAVGKPILTVVVTGLLQETQDTMDTGRKRTTADVLAIHSETNSNVLASVSRRVWMWNQGNYKFSNITAPSTGEILDLITLYPGLRRSADIGQRISTSFRAANASVTGVAHHILGLIDPALAPEFFAQLETGAGLEDGHPVLTLRDRLVRDKVTMKRSPFHQSVAFHFRAWNAVREGRPLTRIIHTAEEPMVLPV